MQRQILDKQLRFYVIDAYQVAQATGMGTRINTIMQTCFFAISGVLPREQAIEKIKEAIHKTYGKKGEEVVRRTSRRWITRSLTSTPCPVAGRTVSGTGAAADRAAAAPEFVRDVTAMMMAGRGDELPVSALPVDGTFPPGPRPGRSATSPRSSRCGSRTSASSAATAASSARTA